MGPAYHVPIDTLMEITMFTHKPKTLDKFAASPVGNKAEYATAWDAARASDWYEDGLGYVGTDGEFHYFQKHGLTTGFARVPVSPLFKN